MNDALRIASLEAQLQNSQKELELLREAMGMKVSIPIQLGLTKNEAIILGVLMKKDIAHKEAIWLTIYAAKADRIAVYSPLGDVVAVIELVSPGNKNSRHAIRSFVDKTLDFLRQGIHILIIDLFPPSRRDPQGIHKVIWDEVREEAFELPSDKLLTLVAYSAGVPKTAYVDPVAVGDTLPDMPVFLDSATYILAPLEATYLATWETCPEELRELIATPAR